MRFPPHFPKVFMVTALLAACRPAPDADPRDAQSSESAAGGGMSEAGVAQALACWLNDATPEEAMGRVSPLGETTIDLGGHIGKVCYGRPSANGRQVEGGLIPFGEPWRLGANEATAIHIPFPVAVGGIELQPGSHSLYAVADEYEWEFFLNSNSDRWGIPINDAVMASNIGSFTGLPRTITEPVEQFTIGWHTQGDDSGHLVLEWGTTRVEIEVRLLDHVH